jgi:hypothetical protein
VYVRTSRDKQGERPQDRVAAPTIDWVAARGPWRVATRSARAPPEGRTVAGRIPTAIVEVDACPHGVVIDKAFWRECRRKAAVDTELEMRRPASILAAPCRRKLEPRRNIVRARRRTIRPCDAGIPAPPTVYMKRDEVDTQNVAEWEAGCYVATVCRGGNLGHLGRGYGHRGVNDDGARRDGPSRKRRSAESPWNAYRVGKTCCRA